MDAGETAAYCTHSLGYAAQGSSHEAPVLDDDESAVQADNLGNAEGQPVDNERPLAADNKFYFFKKKSTNFWRIWFENLRLHRIETVG